MVSLVLHELLLRLISKLYTWQTSVRLGKGMSNLSARTVLLHLLGLCGFELQLCALGFEFISLHFKIVELFLQLQQRWVAVGGLGSGTQSLHVVRHDATR